jgi:hypothetical protein
VNVGILYTVFLLLQNANPAMPPPRRSIVDGSGTGAASGGEKECMFFTVIYPITGNLPQIVNVYA